MQLDELLNSCPCPPFNNKVYQLIYTSFPSKNLFADIGFREGDPDLDIVQEIANSDAYIDFMKPQAHRPFQYGRIMDLPNFVSEVIPKEELLFPLKNANASRFSDGSFGVFYAAKEENTALAEVCHHFIIDSDYQISNCKRKIPYLEVDKRVVVLDIKLEKTHDFTSYRNQIPELISDDYCYCQSLGLKAISNRYPMFQTPSARTKAGTCIPIFFESVLSDDSAKTIKYFNLRYGKKNGLEILNVSSETRSLFTPPLDWVFECKDALKKS